MAENKKTNIGDFFNGNASEKDVDENFNALLNEVAVQAEEQRSVAERYQEIQTERAAREAEKQADRERKTTERQAVKEQKQEKRELKRVDKNVAKSKSRTLRKLEHGTARIEKLTKYFETVKTVDQYIYAGRKAGYDIKDPDFKGFSFNTQTGTIKFDLEGCKTQVYPFVIESDELNPASGEKLAMMYNVDKEPSEQITIGQDGSVHFPRGFNDWDIVAQTTPDVAAALAVKVNDLVPDACEFQKEAKSIVNDVAKDFERAYNKRQREINRAKRTVAVHDMKDNVRSAAHEIAAAVAATPITIGKALGDIYVTLSENIKNMAVTIKTSFLDFKDYCAGKAAANDAYSSLSYWRSNISKTLDFANNEMVFKTPQDKENVTQKLEGMLSDISKAQSTLEYKGWSRPTHVKLADAVRSAKEKWTGIKDAVLSGYTSTLKAYREEVITPAVQQTKDFWREHGADVSLSDKFKELPFMNSNAALGLKHTVRRIAESDLVIKSAKAVYEFEKNNVTELYNDIKHLRDEVKEMIPCYVDASTHAVYASDKAELLQTLSTLDVIQEEVSMIAAAAEREGINTRADMTTEMEAITSEYEEQVTAEIEEIEAERQVIIPKIDVDIQKKAEEYGGE